MSESFNVEPGEGGLVRIRTDAPGERATSVLVDPEQAIRQIAAAAGFAVDINGPVEEAPVEATQLPADPPAAEPEAEA